jgi:hypothetical protein
MRATLAANVREHASRQCGKGSVVGRDLRTRELRAQSPLQLCSAVAEADGADPAGRRRDEELAEW